MRVTERRENVAEFSDIAAGRIPYDELACGRATGDPKDAPR